MGAVKFVTNAYATLKTTAGLKRMWLIALGTDLMISLSLFSQLIRGEAATRPQLLTLLGIVLLVVGKGYAEFAAYKLVNELPVVPIGEHEALSNLELLARIWTVCFLVLLTILVVNIAAGAMLMISLVAGLIFGVFAWLFFQIPYFGFIETVTSPFLGFFRVEGKVLSLVHISPNAAIALAGAMFIGLYLAPTVMALILLARRNRLRPPAPESPPAQLP